MCVDRVDGEWEMIDSIATKHVTYWMKLDNPLLKTKQFEVKSVYKCTRKEEQVAYVIDIVTVTPDIPYGDCFHTENRYCITWVDKNSSRLIISSEVTFQKYTMLKAIIKANATKGLSDKALAVLDLLKSKLIRPSDAKITGTVCQVSKSAKNEKEIITNSSSVSSFGKRTIFLLILSFFLGVFVCWISIADNISHRADDIIVKLNWNKEFSQPGTSEPSSK